VRLDLGNTGDFVEVRDVRSIDDEGERAQVVTDAEAFVRDPQRRTLEAVLDAVGVTNSSLSLRHPTSKTGDLRDHLGKANVGHTSDGQYGAMLDEVKRQVPRWLSQLRDQASEAAKAAQANLEGARGLPDAERFWLGEKLTAEQEADQAHRAEIMAKAAFAQPAAPARTGRRTCSTGRRPPRRARRGRNAPPWQPRVPR
jgi:hypothetical protein